MAYLGKLVRALKVGAALAAVSLTTSGCMTLGENRAAQMGPLPQDRAIAWSPANRLYQSVTVDYVSGMDQHSYLFGKANQAAFRPMLEHVLAQTGMLAPTPLAARYGLRVEFKDLQGNAVGTDFAARSVATYRLVNRLTGETVFEREVPAQFTALFPGMNEHDAERVVQRLPESAGFLGLAAGAYAATQFKYVEHKHYTEDIGGFAYSFSEKDTYKLAPDAHADFIKVYQASIAYALFNEVSAGLDAFMPWNFVAFANYPGSPPREPVLGAPRGVLSEGGIGARSGTEREKQADYMMMGQSLTKFVIGLSDAEHVRFITRLPCINNVEILAIKEDLQAHGMLWETDECSQYPDRYKPGMTYTSGK